MNRINIGIRLIVTILTILTIQVGSGYMGYMNINKLDKLIEKFDDKILPSVEFLLEGDRDLHQLLVAERSMALVSPDSTAFKSFLTSYQDNFEQAKTRFDKYAALAETQEEANFIKEYRTAMAQWQAISQGVVAGIESADDAGRKLAVERSLGQSKAMFDNMRSFIDKLTEIKLQQSEQFHTFGQNMVKEMQNTTLLFLGISLAMGVLLCVLLTRSITVPLKRLAAYAHETASGNFTAELHIKGTDEVAKMGRALQGIPKAIGAATGEFGRLVKAVEQGELAARADETHFEQGFAELVQGGNKLAQVYTNIIDAVPVNIVTLDKDLGIRFMNSIALENTGLTLEQAYAKKCSNIFQPQDGNEATFRAFESGHTEHGESVCTPGGKTLDTIYSASPLKDADGKILGVMKVITDLTEIKAAQHHMEQTAHTASDIATRLASASEELSAQIEQVGCGADIQLQRMNETATAMDQMNATASQVAQNAGGAAKGVEDQRTRAGEGAEVVRMTVEAIDGVNGQAGELKNTMQALGEKAEAIGQVMNVISDIADQTNLLALNAAIEAARAGEAGRGFAVVADEVRKLAEKTMAATKEVGDSISAIQDSAKLNIETTEGATKAIAHAADLAGRTGEVFAAILEAANANTARVQEIATAAEEQSAASDQVTAATAEVSRIVSETTVGMQASTQAVYELSQLSAELNNLMNAAR